MPVKLPQFFYLLTLKIDFFTEKWEKIANSVSFAARDFKIALHILNIVVISYLQKLCVPCHFYPLCMSIFEKSKIGSLAVEFSKSGVLVLRYTEGSTGRYISPIFR